MYSVIVMVYFARLVSGFGGITQMYKQGAVEGKMFFFSKCLLTGLHLIGLFRCNTDDYLYFTEATFFIKNTSATGYILFFKSIRIGLNFLFIYFYLKF